MHEAGYPKPVLWDNPEGWGGRAVGGVFRMGGHMYMVMAKTIPIL